MPCHSQWSIGHRPLVSSQFCPAANSILLSYVWRLTYWGTFQAIECHHLLGRNHIILLGTLVWTACIELLLDSEWCEWDWIHDWSKAQHPNHYTNSPPYYAVFVVLMFSAFLCAAITLPWSVKTLACISMRLHLIRRWTACACASSCWMTSSLATSLVKSSHLMAEFCSCQCSLKTWYFCSSSSLYSWNLMKIWAWYFATICSVHSIL